MKTEKTYLGPILKDPIITGKDRRKKKQLLTPPSLNSLIQPKSFDEYAKDYFRSILDIPRMPSPADYLFNGEDYELPAFEDGKQPATYQGRVLPEPVITPDPELRKRVNQTWPDKQVRLMALNEINDYKNFGENPNGGTYYYGVNHGYNTGVYDTNRGKLLPANYEVEKAMDLVNASGNPDVYTFKNRDAGIGYNRSYHVSDSTVKKPNWLLKLFLGIFAPSKLREMQDRAKGLHLSRNSWKSPYFEELSHAYLFNNNLQQYGYHGNADRSDYQDHNNIEYLAHSIIQPNMILYLRTPESYNTDKLLLKTKKDISTATNVGAYRDERSSDYINWKRR